MNSPYRLLIHGYELVLTCHACPEQYQVYDTADTQVGYIRIRHNKMTVHCPDYGVKNIVLTESTEGDGCLMKHERLRMLNKAVTAIQEWIMLQDDLPLEELIDIQEEDPFSFSRVLAKYV